MSGPGAPTNKKRSAMPKKYNSEDWTGPIENPAYNPPNKHEKAVLQTAYHQYIKERQGGSGFKLKRNVIALAAGVGCLVAAYLLRFRIDFDTRSGRLSLEVLIFIFVIFGLLFTASPLLNGVRFLWKSAGLRPVSALEDNPVLEVLAVILLLGAGVVVFELFLGRL